MSTELLPQEILDLVPAPVYFSTACEAAELLISEANKLDLHPMVPMLIEWAGWLHRRCIKEHKFFGDRAPCVCTCHPPKRNPVSRSMAGIRPPGVIVDEAVTSVMTALERYETVIPASVVRELEPLVRMVSEVPPRVVSSCEAPFPVRVVTQTITLEDEDGSGRTANCLQAALATALGMGLEEVPHFTEYRDWELRMVTWLRERGWELRRRESTIEVLRGIALGMSPRGVRHAVAVVNGTQYDVHPSRSGLVSVDTVVDLVPRWCDCQRCTERDVREGWALHRDDPDM